jgi:hypothetical protein
MVIVYVPAALAASTAAMAAFSEPKLETSVL